MSICEVVKIINGRDCGFGKTSFDLLLETEYFFDRMADFERVSNIQYANASTILLAGLETGCLRIEPEE